MKRKERKMEGWKKKKKKKEEERWQMEMKRCIG
jgi:hypothetical protein